jgi:hypothetical protein
VDGRRVELVHHFMLSTKREKMWKRGDGEEYVPKACLRARLSG